MCIIGRVPDHSSAHRLTAVDALRGVVMVIMALDHARDFIHAGAMTFNRLDLTRTTPMLFITRWITHVCAPSFMLLAGAGAFLLLARDRSTARVARFLWTRGVWLIVLELIVLRLAMNFSFVRQHPVLLLVLSALGVSMIALAALIYLPALIVASVSVAIVLLHNMLDGCTRGESGGVRWHLERAAPAWRLRCRRHAVGDRLSTAAVDRRDGRLASASARS